MRSGLPSTATVPAATGSAGTAVPALDVEVIDTADIVERVTEFASRGFDVSVEVPLRAALFEPGSAYGPDADSQYRVLLETTLWF